MSQRIQNVPDSFSSASSSDSKLEELSHVSQVTAFLQQPTPHAQNTLVDGVTKEEIIKVALSYPVGNRHLQLKTHFGQDGRLRKPWITWYDTEIRALRDQAIQAKRAASGKSSKPNKVLCEDCKSELHRRTVDGGGKKCTACRNKAGLNGTPSTAKGPLPAKKTKTSMKSRVATPSNALVLSSEGDAGQHQRSQSLRSRRSATVDGIRSSPVPQSPNPVSFSSPLGATNNSLPEPTSIPQETRKRLRIVIHTERANAPPSEALHESNEQQLLAVQEQRSHEIECRNEACSTKHFTTEELQEDYKLSMEVAKQDLRKMGYWLCPPCARKAGLMSQGEEQKEIGPEKGNPSPILSKNIGQEWLDDSKISGPLDQLSGLILQFTADAYKNPWPPHTRNHVLEVPCIRDEDPADMSPGEPLVTALRRMLRVERGVPIVAVIRSLQVDSDNSLWISGVLGVLLREFIFNPKSLFDDPSFCLLHLGYTPQDVAKILQSTRLHTLSIHPADFSSRVLARRETFVRQLNETMLPLVGCSPEKTSDYNVMAIVAEKVALKMSAYADNYVPIYPKTGDQLDRKEHEPEDEGGTRNGVAQYVLLTTMLGVKVEIPGGKWRVCSKAKVRLWPVVEKSVPGSSSTLSRKRPLEELSE